MVVFDYPQIFLKRMKISSINEGNFSYHNQFVFDIVRTPEAYCLYKKELIAELFPNLVRPEAMMTISELLKNALAHGGNGDEKGLINLAILVNENKTLTGIHDGGDYFKNSKIKQIYEQGERTQISNSEPVEGLSGYGVGNSLIFHSDLIIDENKGILYSLMDFESK